MRTRYRERRQTNEVRRHVILRCVGHTSALDTLDPDAIEYVADTDKLLTGCSYSATQD